VRAALLPPAGGVAGRGSGDLSRVLVTGGAGFIGSHVVDKLLAAGHEPRIFDVRVSPYREHVGVEAVLGSVCDLDALIEAMRGCDAVMHLAAAADVGEVAKAPVESEELNTRGTLTVLQAARAAGVERVIYASTIWVYSDVPAETVDEDTALHPPAHLYTATKLAGELYCRSYAELYDLQYTILRFGIPYGPRARPAAVVPAFVGKALAGEPLTIAGTGEQSRRFVYVEDLAEGVVCALAPGAANRVYNLVGDEDVSIREIAETVRDLVGDVEIVHTEGRAGDFAGAEVCGARAAAELGWRPRTGFAEGVARYLEWHRPFHAPQPVTAASPRRMPAWVVQVPRHVALLLIGLLAGLLAATLSRIDALDDPPTFVGAAVLLCATALPLARIDWARRGRDSLELMTAMIAGVGLGLFAVTATPDLLHLARTHLDPLVLAVVAVGVGTGIGRRIARA
jgi:UDP-glucose 4-epimerase